MQNRLLVVAYFTALVSGDLQSAESNKLKCPESIGAESIRVEGIEKKWTSFIASPLYLHSAAPMSGPPEMRGDLADFSERRTKHEWSYTYHLKGSFPGGKWLQCGYGEYNQVTLSQRLRDDVQRCTFTYRKGEKAGQYEIRIDCR